MVTALQENTYYCAISANVHWHIREHIVSYVEKDCNLAMWLLGNPEYSAGVCLPFMLATGPVNFP